MRRAILLTAALSSPLAQAMEPMQPGWPMPMDHGHLFGMLLVDQLEARTDLLGAAGAADMEGWYGGDRDRLRYRLEGALDPAEGTGEGELGLAYSRLVGPWLELQLGAGAEAQTEAGTGWEARLEAGVEWVVPYDLDVEAFVRVSHRGRLSLRVTGIKELQLSQRLILQARLEAQAALQESTELDAPAGLDAVSAGLRLRYEARRELAPYLGGQWEGAMPGPSGGGGMQSAWTAVAGLRMWF